ncbi:MAG: hypothetical protein Q8N10_16995 [Phenylobacterium sp.]|uniref:hypothetical protein n=1 Tax=Phenylobacterium sp. TaxID=1871053 RepID=UPI00271D0D6A|nr:hypothetical protein [Phenylobacterium sp.]MDO8914365.1 hypothetical protein [Phenylobacterium sp.]MDP3102185.1 hypothetical protein [Phenylobacterium sp.]
MGKRLNREGREIWFGRILWGYYPSHPKGWILLVVGTVAAIVLVHALIRLGAGWETPALYVLLPICVIALLIMADRHAED